MTNENPIKEKVETLIENEIGGSWEIENYTSRCARIRGKAVGQDIARFVNHFARTPTLDITYIQALNDERGIVVKIVKA